MASKTTKPVVFVIGASGTIGKATVQALSLGYGQKLHIKAGVRNPEKAKELNELVGVTVVQAEMGQKEKLKETFQGVNALYIVVPSSENRAQLTITTTEAAKEAEVQHVLVLSAVMIQLPDSKLGKPFDEIEKVVSSLGVSHIFIRLPFFIDNYYAYIASIKNKSEFYGAVDPNMPYTPVAAEDVGSAAAAILASPEKHAGKTYTLVSDRHTFGDVAKAFSKELGREVKYVRISYEDAKASFMQSGIEEWVVDGLLQAYKLIDEGSRITNQENLGDFSEITRKKPTSLSTWISKVATAFK